jgi:hypothetical protein
MPNPPYRQEPLIEASLKTAAANLAILRTQAAFCSLPLTANETSAALRIAIQFERIVHQRAMPQGRRD